MDLAARLTRYEKQFDENPACARVHIRRFCAVCPRGRPEGHRTAEAEPAQPHTQGHPRRFAGRHEHRYVQAMHDVILQVSDDPEFKTGLTTLYNNDTDNSARLGVGTDREYFELEFGRVVAGKGVKARYVRGYTKGSSLSALNCWEEIEVYALPAK